MTWKSDETNYGPTYKQADRHKQLIIAELTGLREILYCDSRRYRQVIQILGELGQPEVEETELLYKYEDFWTETGIRPWNL